MEPKKFYSPLQIALGSLWGGPLAAVYFLRKNYLALGKTESAQKTVVIGSLLILALIALLAYLPENFPSMIIPFVYCAAAAKVAMSTQLEKADIAKADEFEFASNWGVFGLGIVSLVLFFIFAVVIMLIMDFMGLITLA